VIVKKTFESTDEPLSDLLRSIRDKRLQLPDFQRGWVWDDVRIRSLLASVSLSYPIGAVMLLQTGGDSVRFQARTVEGVSSTPAVEPEEFILDGQQRLTSLYQALFRKEPVDTTDPRGRRIKRLYYLDCAKALEPNADREEAIVGIPEDRKVKNFRREVQRDYSTRSLECAAEMLPLTSLFDETERNDWQQEYLKQAGQDGILTRLNRWNELYETVIRRFQEYTVPVILLRKDTPKEAVCQVFEKVNTGGVPLNVFELLTATYAAENPPLRLRDDWVERGRRLRCHPVLRGVGNTDFLQAIALAVTWTATTRAVEGGTAAESAPGIGCKRKDILNLKLSDYRQWSERITIGFEKAGKLLHGLKMFATRDIPYTTQLVPLAATMALLDGKADNDGVRSKLTRWLWCGVFGELYGGATETRFARDVPELVNWVRGGPDPSAVTEAFFSPGRLRTLRTRNSAAYKGMQALLLQGGAKDFRTGVPIDEQAYFDEQVDIHHIFPQRWCQAMGITASRWDSIVNKAPLSATTNRIIGSNAPSTYLERIQRNAEIGDAGMDEILRSQAIDPTPLRSNDFEVFFLSREADLLTRIEAAMGKPVFRENVEEGEEPPVSYDEEDAVV